MPGNTEPRPSVRGSSEGATAPAEVVVNGDDMLRMVFWMAVLLAGGSLG